YYKVDGDGKIERLRRECPAPECGAGVFMTEAPKSSHPAKPRARNSRASKSNGDATRRATAERTPAYDGYAAQDDRGAMFSHQ
ncbi:hypothetical protein ARAM_007753, partial [Aspergillus rambellii]